MLGITCAALGGLIVGLFVGAANNSAIHRIGAALEHIADMGAALVAHQKANAIVAKTAG